MNDLPDVKLELMLLILNLHDCCKNSAFVTRIQYLQGGVNNVKMAALMISVLPQKRFRLNDSFKNPDRYTVRNQMVQNLLGSILFIFRHSLPPI